MSGNDPAEPRASRSSIRVLVLLGAPGAGKGTQATILAERLGLPHVSTGELFRAALRDGTPLGLKAKGYMERGELVPDDVTVGMLLERLEAPDASTGAILDGFPRTRAQAEALDVALAERGTRVYAAPLVDVPEAELFRRLSGRWLCEAAGHPYHETGHPPRVPGICDIDGSGLIQRIDDQPNVVRARLEKQLGALAEVVAHYREAGVLRVVDGRGTIDEVAAGVVASLAAFPAGSASS